MMSNANNSRRSNNGGDGSNSAAPTIARLDEDTPLDPVNVPASLTNPNPAANPWVVPPLVVDGGGRGGDGRGEFNDAQAMWRERERRQRSIRSLTMFLMMLLLMDGEEQQKQRQRQNGDNTGGLRKGKNWNGKNGIYDMFLDPPLYHARRRQDEMIEQRLWDHPRYQQLQAKNEGKNIDYEVRQWVEQHTELQKDEFAPPEGDQASGAGALSSSAGQEDKSMEPDLQTTTWHYPWNSTGFYRGDWVKDTPKSKMDFNSSLSSKNDAPSRIGEPPVSTQPSSSTNRQELPSSESLPESFEKVSPIEAETAMLQVLQQKSDSSIGVHLLPMGLELELPNRTVSDEAGSNALSFFSKSRRIKAENQSPFLRGNSINSFALGGNVPDGSGSDPVKTQTTLTKTSGRAAFQLNSRTVPAMKELSIVDGFVKLYDSDTVGYSTRRDLLLRVHGVQIHSLGRLSLVANVQTPGRAALVIGQQPDPSDSHNDVTSEDRRRLQELVESKEMSTDGDSAVVAEIRDEVLNLFHGTSQKATQQLISDENSNLVKDEDLSLGMTFHELGALRRRLDKNIKSDSSVPDSENTAVEQQTSSAKNNTDYGNMTSVDEYKYSSHVVPFPFVWDDEEQSVENMRLPSSTRTMPPREQLLEANAGSCEFEINMNIREEEWTLGQWRDLVGKHVSQAILLDPTNRPASDLSDGVENEELDVKGGKTIQKKKPNSISPGGPSSPSKDLEQALVMTMNGTVESIDCDFFARINATAIRTDWDNTTSKAINYSFYMMLTCLTQIVLLLRQLLHTQAQSAATRVSLMCIGWQTVVDALLCLVHIYLSLAMQPLFTAFASVAFFKLLIFCVIEMKYMAIIIQARNASNGGNTLELLRRQIAMLHLRFYVALLAACLGFFYSGETYRTAYMLLLYSFWVPQIVQNIVTEAKRPLHQYYVYGMSTSRLVAPIYIFAVKNNFLKEVYPEFSTDAFMCQLLVLWVGIQAGILEAQGRYGARFMIPARFLPPKFDYNRPIPRSLFPNNAQAESPSEELQNERKSSTNKVRSVAVPNKDPSLFGGGTRHRIKGSKINRAEGGMTAETITSAPKNSCMPKFDCVICYNEIDPNNRTGYMLAPCDHLFHKDCLVQWMEVKMECKI